MYTRRFILEEHTVELLLRYLTPFVYADRSGRYVPVRRENAAPRREHVEMFLLVRRWRDAVQQSAINEILKDVSC